MPRREKPLFNHEVAYAPDVIDNGVKYSARIKGVDMARGKIRVKWNIYASFKKKKKRKMKEVAP